MKRIAYFSALALYLLASMANSAIITMQVSSTDTHVNPGATLNANLSFDTLTNSVSGTAELNNIDPAKFGSSAINFSATSISLESFQAGGMLYGVNPTSSPGRATIGIYLTSSEGNSQFPNPYLSFNWTSIIPVIDPSAPHTGFQSGVVNNLEMLAANYSASGGDGGSGFFVSVGTNYDDTSSKLAFSDGYNQSHILWQVLPVPIPASGLLFMCPLSGLLAKLRRKI
jgi:hypothetical protein